jgi:hypothetical protein
LICTSGIKRLNSKGNIFGGATNHWSPILCFVNFFVKIYTLFRDIKIHFPLHAMQFHQPILFTTKTDIFSIAKQLRLCAKSQETNLQVKNVMFLMRAPVQWSLFFSLFGINMDYFW